MTPPSRRRVLRRGGALLSAALAGCAALAGRPGPDERPPEAIGSDWTPPAGTWAMTGGGPRNRRAVEAPGPTDDPAVVRRFPDSAPTYDTSRTVVAATAETAYLLHRSERRGAATVRALRTDDWTERWRHEFPGEVGVRPGGLAGDRLYAAADGRVVALGTDGRQRWETDLYGRLAETVGRPYLPEDRADLDLRAVPTPGTVALLSSYGLHGLDPADGAERWRVAFPGGVEHFALGVAVARDAVWTVTDDVAYRLDGDGLAALRLPDLGFTGPPVPDAGRVLLTAGGGTVDRPAFTAAAYNPASAAPVTATPTAPEPAWAFDGHPSVDASATYVTPAAVADGRVVVGEVVSPAGTTDQRAAVYGVDAATGERRWTRAVDVANPDEVDLGVAAALSAPVVAAGTVYVGVAPRWTFEQRPVPGAGALVALAADTGEVRWRRTVGIVPRRLAVAGDSCYVADYDGGLVVVR